MSKSGLGITPKRAALFCFLINKEQNMLGKTCWTGKIFGYEVPEIDAYHKRSVLPACFASQRSVVPPTFIRGGMLLCSLVSFVMMSNNIFGMA